MPRGIDSRPGSIRLLVGFIAKSRVFYADFIVSHFLTPGGKFQPDDWEEVL